MKIIVLPTSGFTEMQWSSYISGFNQVFNSNFNKDYFEKKYCKTIKGHSYHSLLETDMGDVVGGCTVIPYEYWVNSHKQLMGLCVDVFILKSYRKDPFVLSKLYAELKREMLIEGITCLMGVPNENAYPYLKKVIHWKDIGLLPYYALPVKLGSVLKKFRCVNLFSRLLAFVWTYLCGMIGWLIGCKEDRALVRINRDNEVIEEHRYGNDHKIVNSGKGKFAYRVANEKGIRTALLIDFYDHNKNRSAGVLFSAVLHLLRNENPDIIVFVGPIRFRQLLLFKVPRRLEPRPLRFVGGILNSEIIEQEIMDFNKWDFGLFNCDVR